MKNKRQIIACIICILSIAYIVFATVLCIFPLFKGIAISTAESILQKKLDHGYWYSYLNPFSKWYFLSVLAVVFFLYFALYNLYREVLDRFFSAVLVIKERYKIINSFFEFLKKREGVLLAFICLGVLFISFYRLISLAANIAVVSSMNCSLNEVRDYVDFRLAHLFIEGKNPYISERLTSATVPFMCLYTPLMPFIVSLLCRALGISVISGYYLTNILIFILTVFCIWFIIRDDCLKDQPLVIVICIAVNAATFFSFIGLPLYNFHTDSIGILVEVLIFLVVKKDMRKVFILSLLSVSLIFTKQILVVMVIPLFVFYLINDRILALRYALYGIAASIVVFIVGYLFYPLYWGETIYAQFITSRDYGSFQYAVSNIKDFYLRYAPYWILMLIFIVLLCLLDRKLAFNGLLKRIKVFSGRYEVYLLNNVIFCTIVLLYFAKCGPDGYKYCQDLLAPCLFLLFIHILFNNRIGQLIKEIGLSRKWTVLLLTSIVSVLVFSNFNCKLYSETEIAELRALKEMISTHSDGSAYLGINSSQFLLENDIWDSDNYFFNDGQIEFFDFETDRDSIISAIFHANELNDSFSKYKNKVNDMVKNREFSIITTCIDRIIDEDTLTDNYYVYNKYNIRSDLYTFEVSVWLPKDAI